MQSKHSQAVKDGVIVAWKSGESENHISERTGIARTTLRQWLIGHSRQGVLKTTAFVPSLEEEQLDSLARQLVTENIKAVLAIYKQAQDPNWTKLQNAADLGVFLGISFDKLARLLSAVERVDEQTIEGESTPVAQGVH